MLVFQKQLVFHDYEKSDVNSKRNDVFDLNCCYAITVVHCMITCCKNVESILINIMIMILIIDDSLENTFIKYYKKRRPHKDHLPQHPRHPTTSICRKGNVTQSIKYYHKTRSTTATKDVY